MSKREARLAREAEKRLRQQESSARLRARPIEEKTPRRGADPGSIFQMMMEWTGDSADKEGLWSWGVEREWGDEAWNGIIHPKLQDFEKLRWYEIEAFTTGGDERHRAHHLMDCNILYQEAQDRLAILEHGYAQIFRFRFGGKRRLWGFRNVNVFEILWYDPTHNVYPTEPD